MAVVRRKETMLEMISAYEKLFCKQSLINQFFSRKKYLALKYNCDSMEDYLRKFDEMASKLNKRIVAIKSMVDKFHLSRLSICVVEL